MEIASETLLTTKISFGVFNTTQPGFSIASAAATVLFSIATSSKANLFAVPQTLLRATLIKI